MDDISVSEKESSGLSENESVKQELKKLNEKLALIEQGFEAIMKLISSSSANESLDQSKLQFAGIKGGEKAQKSVEIPPQKIPGLATDSSNLTYDSQTRSYGSQTYGDGSQTQRNDSQTHPDGSSTQQDGSLTRRYGSQNQPDGSQNQRDGSQTNRDGSQNSPDGSQTNRDGSQNQPDGSQTHRDGSQSRPDGSQTHRDGSQSRRDDSLTYNYGSSTQRNDSSGSGIDLKKGGIKLNTPGQDLPGSKGVENLSVEKPSAEKESSERSLAGKDEAKDKAESKRILLDGYLRQYYRPAAGAGRKIDYRMNVFKLIKNNPSIQFPGTGKIKRKIEIYGTEIIGQALRLQAICQDKSLTRMPDLNRSVKAVKILVSLNELKISDRKEILNRSGLAKATFTRAFNLLRQMGYAKSLFGPRIRLFMITDEGKTFFEQPGGK